MVKIGLVILLLFLINVVLCIMIGSEIIQQNEINILRLERKIERMIQQLREKGEDDLK